MSTIEKFEGLKNKTPLRGVSVIIPCLNEASHIQEQLPRLISYLGELKCPYEIILIDNGSSDGSALIAESLGARVEIMKGVTISSLRNAGAKLAKYDVLAFLDADIEVTESWIEALEAFLANNMNGEGFITGAPVLRPPQHSLVERLWFNGSEFRKIHINSANMIVKRDVFLSIGGFDQNLESGEDWELCHRARNHGVKVRIDKNFKAYHHGFPKTFRQFFVREIWHGCGDFKTIRSFARSRPAIVAVANASLFVTLVAAATYKCSFLPLALYPPIALGIVLPIALKRSVQIWQVPGNIFLAFLYIWGRFLSLFRVWMKRFVTVREGCERSVRG